MSEYILLSDFLWPDRLTGLSPPAVPLASLPPELLLTIVQLTLPAGPVSYKILADRSKWLHSLLFLCKALSGAARVQLYKHLLLPSPKRGWLLVRTLKSARWRKGLVAGHPGRAVRSVRFGHPVIEMLVEDASWVERVLERVAGEGVREVGLAGLAVDHNVLGKMQHVTCLELSSIALFPHHTPFLLPCLTHLSLTDPDRLALRSDSSAYGRLLRPSVLPQLTHLTIHISYLSPNSLAPAPVLASFVSLTPQLRYPALREATPWLATATTPEPWRALAVLDELHYWAPQMTGPGSLAWAAALKELPHGPHVLALGDAWALLGVCLELLKRAYEEEWSGVKGVEVLRLPSARLLALDGLWEGDGWLLEQGLQSVARVAEENGARVEWTWWDEAAGEWAVNGPAGELPPSYF